MACRSTFAAGAVALYGVCGLADPTAAQPGAAPMIQRVTLQPDTGVITVAGTGFGPDMFVSVDGQPAAVLLGASETQVEVTAPTSVLTVPGTYRLTVVDRLRHVGDAFVVASTGGRAMTASRAPAGGPTAPEGAVRESAADGAAADPVSRVTAAPPPLTVIEDTGSPFRTAIGFQALSSNTTGSENTASGYQALAANTTGSFNAASGALSLRSNTTGGANTANGRAALASNTTGGDNTATGFEALAFNTTGRSNTASGYQALESNATGFSNTATGADALYSNATGGENTANGAKALFSNTGSWNTATGVRALFSNTTGQYNTAGGVDALAFNTTGQQLVATGYVALANNTTGSFNTATGATALALNTTGTNNVATGAQALNLNTAGNDNTATGTSALFNSTASFNTAHGTTALYNLTTGGWNVALGDRAGLNATTGSYNVFVGAGVHGTAGDANTMRLGLPYSGGVGQDRTFIAGIHGTVLSGPAVQVFVDGNGQLGTVTAGVQTGTISAPVAALQRQLQQQQATIDALLARIARLEVAARGRRQ